MLWTTEYINQTVNHAVEGKDMSLSESQFHGKRPADSQQFSCYRILCLARPKTFANVLHPLSDKSNQTTCKEANNLKHINFHCKDLY